MTTATVPVHVPGEGITTPSLLIEQARIAWQEKQAIDRAANEERMRLEEERGRDVMCEQLQRRLGLQVQRAAVVTHWDEGDLYARIAIDGLMFAAGHQWHEGAQQSLPRLWLVRPCPRCGRDALEELTGIVQLGALLDADPWHRYCPKREADYEIVDDVDDADAAWQACAAAWEAHGQAKTLVMQLEDERALIKPEAIKRLIKAGRATSVTAAEKIVEQDEEYAAHRRNQYEAVLDEQRTYGRAKAAEFRARRFAENRS